MIWSQTWISRRHYLTRLASPGRMQGVSLLPRITGLSDAQVRDAFYYRYYEHDDHMHHVWAHYGLVTERYKLIYYYADGLGLANAGDVTYPRRNGNYSTLMRIRTNCIRCISIPAIDRSVSGSRNGCWNCNMP